MSAGTHAYVSCDHLGSVPGSAARQPCPERIDEGWTKAEVRKIARGRGWLTGVHSDGQKPSRPSWGHFDFCPAHKSALPPAAEEASSASD